MEVSRSTFRRRAFARALAGLLLAAAGEAARGQAYTRLISFGDSLTDVGNTNSITFGISPGSGYYNGRYSNGPLWVEDVATDLSLPAVVNSRAGGYDYATGGSRSGSGNVTPFPFINLPNAGTQINQFLGSRAFATDDLVTLWTGANDFLDGQTDVSVPANNVKAHVQQLIDRGAKNIVVFNLPPLGETPRYRATADRTTMDTRAAQYNAALATNLDSLAVPAGTTLYRVDVAGFFTTALANPSTYGLTNVTDPAMNASAGAPVDQYLFWDDVHPTRAGHALLSDVVFDTVTTRTWRGSPAQGSWTAAANWAQSRVPDSTSTVRLAGSIGVNLSSNLTVRSLSIGGTTGATRLLLQNGAQLSVSNPTRIALNGTLAGDGTIASSTVAVAAGGSIEPGVEGGVGRIGIDGNLALQPGSTLGIDFAPSSSDRIDITGNLAVGGATVRVRFVDGAIVLPGTQAAIASYSAVNASPSMAVVNETKFAGLQIQPILSATTLSLAFSATPGDADLDATVGFGDLLIVARHYNLAGERWLEGDFTADGVVNFDDLLALARNYNTTVGPGGYLASDTRLDRLNPMFANDFALAQSLVPEPTLATSLMGCLLLSTRRRRAR